MELNSSDIWTSQNIVGHLVKEKGQPFGSLFASNHET